MKKMITLYLEKEDIEALKEREGDGNVSSTIRRLINEYLKVPVEKQIKRSRKTKAWKDTVFLLKLIKNNYHKDSKSVSLSFFQGLVAIGKSSYIGTLCELIQYILHEQGIEMYYERDIDDPKTYMFHFPEGMSADKLDEILRKWDDYFAASTSNGIE